MDDDDLDDDLEAMAMLEQENVGQAVKQRRGSPVKYSSQLQESPLLKTGAGGVLLLGGGGEGGAA